MLLMGGGGLAVQTMEIHDILFIHEEYDRVTQWCPTAFGWDTTTWQSEHMVAVMFRLVWEVLIFFLCLPDPFCIDGCTSHLKNKCQAREWSAVTAHMIIIHLFVELIVHE